MIWWEVTDVSKLEIKHLKKYYPTSDGLLHAVDDISLDINEGETVGIVGESGCGKSTLGKTILRLTEPTAGSVTMDGVEITTLSPKQLKRYRTKMQIIFQDPFSSIDPRMTVEQLIAEPLHIHRVTRDKAEVEARVRDLMETVGLDLRFANSYPHELDGGRRQRIGIARALALDPEFIVCDEPVSALDVSIQAQILNLLQDLQAQKKLTYMFITHDLSVVRHISDTICVMYLGQVIEQCATDELFENTLHPYSQALLSAIPIPSVDNRPQRILLTGEVSSPISPKNVCRFAPRCRFCTEDCLTRPAPTLRDVSTGHKVACHKI